MICFQYVFYYKQGNWQSKNEQQKKPRQEFSTSNADFAEDASVKGDDSLKHFYKSSKRDPGLMVNDYDELLRTSEPELGYDA